MMHKIYNFKSEEDQRYNQGSSSERGFPVSHARDEGK